MGPGGQPNLQQLLQQAQQMAQVQAELADAELTAESGGGAVKVVVTGAGEFRSVKIDPKAVDPDDVETLEDLVLAAFHNASETARAHAEEKLAPFTAGLGGIANSLGLPGLPGF